MKKLKKVMLYFILFIAILSLIFYFVYKYETHPNRFAEFLKENPNRSSVYIIKNDSTLVKKNVYKMMPLASTMKWIILILYCEKSSNNEVDDLKLVNIDDVSTYYMPNTDGGAHESWLQNLKKEKKIIHNKIRLIDIARGMTLYSSNACTEYLLDLLGIVEVNKVLKKYNISKHDPINFIVSRNYIIEKNNINDLKKINKLDFNKLSNKIHTDIKNKKIKLKKSMLLSEEKLSILSDLMTHSNTNEYVNLMKKINSEKYVKSSFGLKMNKVFEPWMTKNKLKYNTIWAKGGSTEKILTYSMYIESKNGDKYFIAYFLNNLEIDEYFFLKNAMNSFGVNFTTNNELQTEYLKILNN